MNDVLLVQKLKGEQSLTNYLNGLLLRKNASIENRVEVLSLEILLHDKEVLPVLKDVKHSNDIRMPCVHQNLELVD